jgi:hypothetical protein
MLRTFSGYSCGHFLAPRSVCGVNDGFSGRLTLLIQLIVRNKKLDLRCSPGVRDAASPCLIWSGWRPDKGSSWRGPQCIATTGIFSASILIRSFELDFRCTSQTWILDVNFFLVNRQGARQQTPTQATTLWTPRDDSSRKLSSCKIGNYHQELRGWQARESWGLNFVLLILSRIFLRGRDKIDLAMCCNQVSWACTLSIVMAVLIASFWYDWIIRSMIEACLIKLTRGDTNSGQIVVHFIIHSAKISMDANFWRLRVSLRHMNSIVASSGSCHDMSYRKSEQLGW